MSSFNASSAESDFVYSRYSFAPLIIEIGIDVLLPASFLCAFRIHSRAVTKSSATMSAFSFPCWSTHFTSSLILNVHVRPLSSVPHSFAIPATNCPFGFVSRKPSFVLQSTFKSAAISVFKTNTFSISRCGTS